jgi:hypothetical protein
MPERPRLTESQNIADYDVIPERWRQLKKWGIQTHPDGTSEVFYAELANEAKRLCDQASSGGVLTWADILREEVYEALAEEHPENLRAELVQVAAVAVAWVEDIDRREFARLVAHPSTRKFDSYINRKLGAKKK